MIQRTRLFARILNIVSLVGKNLAAYIQVSLMEMQHSTSTMEGSRGVPIVLCLGHRHRRDVDNVSAQSQLTSQQEEELPAHYTCRNGPTCILLFCCPVCPLESNTTYLHKHNCITNIQNQYKCSCSYLMGYGWKGQNISWIGLHLHGQLNRKARMQSRIFFLGAILIQEVHISALERVRDYNDRSDFKTPMSLSTSLSSLGLSFYYCWLSLRKRQ